MGSFSINHLLRDVWADGFSLQAAIPIFEHFACLIGCVVANPKQVAIDRREERYAAIRDGADTAYSFIE